MSRYSHSLAQARLQALHALQAALLEAPTPDEIRRCAVAILNAPDPCEIDDALDHAAHNENPRTPNVPERELPTRAPTPPALHAQPAPLCNNHANGRSTPAPPHKPTPLPRPAPTPESIARTNAQLDEIEQLITTLESLNPKPSRARSLAARAGQAPPLPAPT